MSLNTTVVEQSANYSILNIHHKNKYTYNELISIITLGEIQYEKFKSAKPDTFSSYRIGDEAERELFETLDTASCLKNYKRIQTNKTPHCGDFLVYDETTSKGVLIENKCYQSRVPTKEVDKFVADLSTVHQSFPSVQIIGGLFLSKKTDISKKKSPIDIELIRIDKSDECGMSSGEILPESPPALSPPALSPPMPSTPCIIVTASSSEHFQSFIPYLVELIFVLNEQKTCTQHDSTVLDLEIKIEGLRKSLAKKAELLTQIEKTLKDNNKALRQAESLIRSLQESNSGLIQSIGRILSDD
jgi:hypothetical protein